MPINKNRTDDNNYLDFEGGVAELDRQMTELQNLASAKGIDYSAEIRKLQQRRVSRLKKIYSNLTPWQIVHVARHPQRPILADYLELMVKDFRQLHGDRNFGDDRAIVTGFGQISGEKVLIVGQNKGRKTEEKIKCNFGCANPEGYRKAMSKMKLAEKYGIPIVALIDTPGAYPGIGAEERGQAQAIAVNLMDMSRLRVPIVCIVIGEGGSGGALGIGVGDRFAMLEFAYYSVISPEGCAAILWRDGSQACHAAEALKLTSKELYKLKLIDAVIAEPLGGAHRNVRETVYNVSRYIVRSLRGLRRTIPDNLIENRYKKLRAVGTNFVGKSLSELQKRSSKPKLKIKSVSGSSRRIHAGV